MKKIILLALAIGSFALVNAQTSPADSLKEYTGKYKFPEGTPFPEVSISVENGTLSASSSAGTAELKRRDGDTFDILSYGGVAIFKRDESKKIKKLQVQISDLDVEGVRMDDGSLSTVFWQYRY
jgi:hypothetical protein